MFRLFRLFRFPHLQCFCAQRLLIWNKRNKRNKRNTLNLRKRKTTMFRNLLIPVAIAVAVAFAGPASAQLKPPARSAGSWTPPPT